MGDADWGTVSVRSLEPMPSDVAMPCGARACDEIIAQMWFTEGTDIMLPLCEGHSRELSSAAEHKASAHG